MLIYRVCTGRYSYPADIWSFGITLIELMNKEPPGFGYDPMEFMIFLECLTEKTHKIEFEPINEDAEHLISNCLQFQEEKRLTPRQILVYTVLSLL